MVINQPRKQELISINIARAFAALGVFYYHQHIGSILSIYTGIPAISFTDSIGANYAVPLFFLISGYCIHLSNIKHLKNGENLSLKAYFKKRFLRIYPVYVVAVLFSVVVTLYTRTLPQPTWQDILVHILLLQGLSIAYFNGVNVVLWTITIEVLLYIIYPVFYIIRSKFSLTYAMLLAFLVNAASIGYFTTQSISFPEFYFVLNIWFAWCCGAYLADKQNIGANNLNKPIYKVLYTFILIAFCWMVNSKYASSIIAYQLKILIWLGPLLFLINNETWFNKHQSLWLIKLLSVVGLSSYSLYVLHVPLIYLKNFLLEKYVPQNSHSVGVVIGIFIIPFITWLSYLYIERPFMVKRQKI